MCDPSLYNTKYPVHIAVQDGTITDTFPQIVKQMPPHYVRRLDLRWILHLCRICGDVCSPACRHQAIPNQGHWPLTVEHLESLKEGT